MNALVNKLGAKLSEWKPEILTEADSLISEVIDAADQGALDLIRSRKC